MNRPPGLLGAVLAGGAGSRFGGPKGDAVVGGRALVARAVETLSEVMDRVVVVSSRPVDRAGVPVLPDLTPGAGPLGGLEAALVAARDGDLGGVFLLACDLPLVEADLVRALARALGDARAVASAREAGGVEPLCAAYVVDILPEVRTALASDDRSLHALFRHVGGKVIASADLPVRDGLSFLNVNTEGDLHRAEDALARRHPS